MSTTPVKNQNQISVKAYFDQPKVMKKFSEIVGENSKSFVVSALQVIGQNENLQKCTPVSVYQAVAMAAVLNMPINPNIGMAYVIPYGNTATLQIGYQGFIQLAINSGQYKTIGASEIYENQIVSINPLTGHVFDFSKTGNGAIVGYAASFELKNGFQKVIYMSEQEMNAHMVQFSKGHNRSDSPWKTNKTSMGCKTVLKKLIKTYGPKSIELQKAIDSDQSEIVDFEDGQFKYPDNPQPQKSTESKADEINSDLSGTEDAEHVEVEETARERMEREQRESEQEM